MMTKKFHQFVVLEKGPVKTAVMDMLKGGVYQVENETVAAFEEGRFEEIPDFIESAAAEGLLIELDEKRWVPRPEEGEMDMIDEEEGLSIELHVEEGVDLAAVLEKFKDTDIHKVFFYGEKPPGKIPGNLEIVSKDKHFQLCKTLAEVKGEFDRAGETTYRLNKTYNNCWGARVAVTADGKIRPCIHSTLSVGDITAGNTGEILGKLEKYWTITKDRVEKCKDCELRYACFDCRELARLQGGNRLYAPPRCNYDPYTGTWDQQ